MPRKPTGNTYQSRGHWYARVTVDKGRRPSYQLAAGTKGAADARADVLADIAAQLRKAGQTSRAERILEDAARADAQGLPAILRAVAAVCSGKATLSTAPTMTLGELAKLWTSGELARRHPDRVKVKRSRAADVSRLDCHVLPIVGSVPIATFDLDDGERVLAALPSALSDETRRHVARLLARLLSLAVYPCRLRVASPLPRTWIPSGGSTKALSWIYPDEDRLLLACQGVPVRWRIFWGFLAREGLRAAEACALDRDDAGRVITLDQNKTDDPRAWAATLGTARAIEAWLATREDDAPQLFIDRDGERLDAGADLAKRFRVHLRRAGVVRAELYEKSAARIPIRAHDLRGTFVTIASACGRSEAWITDRTGHKSSGMVRRYQRAARTAAELGLGDLTPLDQAIPELARKGGDNGNAAGGGSEVRETMSYSAPDRMAMAAIGLYQGR